MQASNMSQLTMSSYQVAQPTLPSTLAPSSVPVAATIHAAAHALTAGIPPAAHALTAGIPPPVTVHPAQQVPVGHSPHPTVASVHPAATSGHTMVTTHTGPHQPTIQAQVHQQQSLHQAQAHAHIQAQVQTQAQQPQQTQIPVQPPSTQQQQQQQQTTAAHVQQQQQQQQQQFQRLKVEDALSYLDQVKIQFGNQPQVYNDFLDIMKEFKSQTIDTPGVITRVSTLFKGHPDLIVGFNTFLPPGYKIEVNAANETISVHQPGQQVLSIAHSASGTATLQPVAPGPVPVPVASVQQQVIAPSQPMSHHSYQHPCRPPQAAPAEPPGPRDAMSGGSLHQYQHQAQSTAQPVEFNHAINYVNKIKNRFQGQPEIYKSFLEILHTYQKEQRNIKEGIMTSTQKPLTEAEVFSQVAKLFQNQEDLLSEFGQFLPDANGSSPFFPPMDTAFGLKNDHGSTVKKPSLGRPWGVDQKSHNNKQTHVRRSSGHTPGQPMAKKPKMTGPLKDISVAEAGKYGTLNEYAFFDKVRKGLKNPAVYDNFLRCLTLFNQEVVSRMELVQLVRPFLEKFPELFRGFKDFLGYKDGVTVVEAVPAAAVTGKERISGELAMEIDYASCKRYGASYRALPKSYIQPRSSGRTALCKEVLNDTWVSFPSWAEDSSFVTSKKTQYEEQIYRCEDERFELDIVLETNLSAIRALEGVQNKLQRMSSEEAAKFRLDNSLGGTSDSLYKRAIHRIYGDKALDIIDGLKKNPVVAVPLVLRRLKAKEEEWREAQRQFNRIWRETNEKYYLKSLDHQGINFKQNDVKSIRSKTLLNEVEAIFDERQDQTSGEPASGPHMSFIYKNRSVLDDATSLVIHHMKRQTGIHKDDKQKIKELLKHFLQDIFFSPRGELSDDEGEKDEDDDDEDSRQLITTERTDKNDKSDKNDKKENKNDKSDSDKRRTNDSVKEKITDKTCKSDNKSPLKSSERGSTGRQTTRSTSSPARSSDSRSVSQMNGHEVDEKMETGGDTDGQEKKYNIPEETDLYSLFFANNNWYLFFRLHYILSERLDKIQQHATRIAAEESVCKRERKESTAIALRLKQPNEVEPEEYYVYFLEMVKNLLDGNLESSSYEDQLRDMFGIHAYIGFTLDKVVQNIVRQLQHISCDDACISVNELYLEHSLHSATGGSLSTQQHRSPAENAYQRRAEQALNDENCFKILLYKEETKLTIELLDTETESQEEPVEVERWSEYVEKYVSSDSSIPSDLKEYLAKKSVFLPRNVRSWRHRNKQPAGVAGGAGGASGPSKDGDDSNPCHIDDNLQVVDNTECKFNVNSFKLVYVVNSESFLYRRNALTRAKQSHKKVSLRLHEKFAKYVNDWCEENADNAGRKWADDFLLGNLNADDQNSCLTTKVEKSDTEVKPYYTHYKYSVKYPNKQSLPAPSKQPMETEQV